MIKQSISWTKIPAIITRFGIKTLNISTEKFIKRFAKTEELVRLKETDMTSLGIDELDEYWKQAKAQN